MTNRPDLFESIRTQLTAQQEGREAEAAPERAAQEARTRADAALYGTPAWDTLGRLRQHMAANYVREHAGTEGGPDAAA